MIPDDLAAGGTFTIWGVAQPDDRLEILANETVLGETIADMELPSLYRYQRMIHNRKMIDHGWSGSMRILFCKEVSRRDATRGYAHQKSYRKLAKDSIMPS